MTCPCNKNNKTLELDRSNKVLELDQMRHMSIDQIVGLYKEGYRLESNRLDRLESNLIKNLAYTDTCSGTADVDKSNTTLDLLYDSTLLITSAHAQKFIPTSKCLSGVTVQLERILNNDAYLEIRKTTTTGDMLPDGNPQSSGGRIAYTTIPYASIPTSAGDVTVTLNALLDDFDMANGVWIVLTLHAYDPNCGTVPGCVDTNYVIKGGSSYTTDQYTASKFGTGIWTKGNAHLYFKTFKQTYTVPGPILTYIELTPASASIGINGTQQLTATCKDQNGVVMTGGCPTLTWDSSDITKVTVNPDGLVTGIAIGSADITASSSSIVSNKSNITISTIPKHKICVNKVCQETDGAGENECTTIGQACTSVTGGGGIPWGYVIIGTGGLVVLYYVTKQKKIKSIKK